LSDEEIAIFHDVMKEKENKFRRGENSLPPKLAAKIADMPLAQLQGDLLRSPAINALLDERIRNPKQDDEASRQQKVLSERLAIAQHKFGDGVDPNPLALVRLYVFHQLTNAKQKDVTLRRQLLEALESDWDTKVKAAVEKSHGEQGYLCLVAIRDYFMDRPSDLPMTIEDARELLIDDLEEKLQRLQPASHGERAGVRDWAAPIKSHLLLEFLTKLYPDKPWEKNASPDQGGADAVVQTMTEGAAKRAKRSFESDRAALLRRPLTKGKGSGPDKNESGKEESAQIQKETLPPAFFKEVFQALTNPGSGRNAAAALVKNALKDHSAEDVLEAFVTNGPWTNFVDDVIDKTKPQGVRQLFHMQEVKKHIDAQCVKAKESSGAALGFLLGNIRKSHETALWERRQLRHQIKLKNFVRNMYTEITLEHFPQLRSRKMIEQETTALYGLAERVTAVLRHGNTSVAALYIEPGAKETSLDKARDAIVNSPTWKRFVRECSDNRALHKGLGNLTAENALDSSLFAVRRIWEIDAQAARIIECLDEDHERAVFSILAMVMNTKSVDFLRSLGEVLEEREIWNRFVAKEPLAQSDVMNELARESSGGLNVLDPAKFKSPNMYLSDANQAFFYELVQRWEAINTANAVSGALASAIGVPPDQPIPVLPSPGVSATAAFIVNTVAQIKDQTAPLKNIETTLGASSYGVVDAKGDFDQRAYSTRLRKHLREKLRTPGQADSGGQQDAIILANLPAPERCAPVMKDGAGTLLITTKEGKLHLEEYFKNKISAGHQDALKNIELVYVKKGQAARITAENAKKTAQSSTQSAKSKKGGKKKR
jgi:hypothetical protein